MRAVWCAWWVLSSPKVIWSSRFRLSRGLVPDWTVRFFILAIAEKIESAVRPVLLGEGFDLVMVEHVSSSRILRLFIDVAEIDDTNESKVQGVSVDDCAKVSRLVGDLMLAEGFEDSIAGKYTLEVSSPGLDRPLVRPRDFVRFVGSMVKLQTRVSRDGRGRFVGSLLAADDDIYRNVVVYPVAQIHQPA